jgi:hypothetical protein
MNKKQLSCESLQSSKNLEKNISFLSLRELIAKNIAEITSNINTIWGAKTSEYYREQFYLNKLEWISSPIDIYDCDINKIQSWEYILKYIQELCIGMWWEMVWNTYIKYFENEDPGITFKQRTNQWLVSGHFKDNTQWACIDIHSREFHDPNLLAEFSTRWFEGKNTELDVSYRPALNKNYSDHDQIITQGWEQSTEYYQAKYESKNVWWMNTALDLHNCDLAKIAEINNVNIHDFVKKFVLDLCDYIDMIRDWDPEVYDINHHWISGLEFSQVITTSLISGHFRHDTQTAYLEIFSCKYYNPNDVASFTKDYFSAGDTQMQVTYRWIDG